MSVRLPDHVDEAAFNHGERVDEGGDEGGDRCGEGEIRYARRERLVGMQRCDVWISGTIFYFELLIQTIIIYNT